MPISGPRAPAALVVENEAMIALDLEASLAAVGFEPIIVASCAAARRWLEVITPDVAILDVLLPDGSSESIARELDGRAVPFVVHSGAPAAQYSGTFLARGYWMPKPANSTEIADRALNTVRAANHNERPTPLDGI